MVTTGVSSCIIKTRLISNAMWNAAQEATKTTAHEIATISKETFCPVDTGSLKESQTENVSENTKSNFTVKISYGNEKVNYAYWVEAIPYNHYNPPNAQWKYLETPLIMYQNKLQSNVTSGMEGVLD